MTTLEQIKKSEEEFAELYNINKFSRKKHLSSKYRTTIEITNAIHPDKIKSFHRSSLISLFEGEIERLELVMKNTHDIKSNEGNLYAMGFNQNARDQISHYQSVIKELKK